MPFPVKIEDNDERNGKNAENSLPKLPSPYMIRHSNSFKLLGLNQLNGNAEDKKAINLKDNDRFQYLQINYKSIQIQIRCDKQTVVQTINGIHHGTVQKEIHLDGHKILEIDDVNLGL
eukprot:UN05967